MILKDHEARLRNLRYKQAASFARGDKVLQPLLNMNQTYYSKRYGSVGRKSSSKR